MTLTPETLKRALGKGATHVALLNDGKGSAWFKFSVNPYGVPCWLIYKGMVQDWVFWTFETTPINRDLIDIKQLEAI